MFGVMKLNKFDGRHETLIGDLEKKKEIAVEKK